MDKSIHPIAERVLTYSRAGSTERHSMSVRIYSPVLADPEELDGSFDGGVATCIVEFVGIAAPPLRIHGVDPLHALAQAVDIDPLIRSLSKEYDFFWTDGAPYFDD